MTVTITLTKRSSAKCCQLLIYFENNYVYLAEIVDRWIYTDVICSHVHTAYKTHTGTKKCVFIQRANDIIFFSIFPKSIYTSNYAIHTFNTHFTRVEISTHETIAVETNTYAALYMQRFSNQFQHIQMHGQANTTRQYRIHNSSMLWVQITKVFSREGISWIHHQI